jgi:hypothetical protein
MKAYAYHKVLLSALAFVALGVVSVFFRFLLLEAFARGAVVALSLVAFAVSANAATEMRATQTRFVFALIESAVSGLLIAAALFWSPEF